MDRPARTFVLPVPLSRMLAAYTLIRESEPNISTEILIPVTNPLERLNKEIKRRTNVVGIFPNEAAIRRLVGALTLEQNDDWAVTRRYMTLETVAAVCEDGTMDPAKIAAL
jgi:transposase-like protein